MASTDSLLLVCDVLYKTNIINNIFLLKFQQRYKIQELSLR